MSVQEPKVREINKEFDDLYVSIQDYDTGNPNNEFADTLYFNHRTLDEVQMILRLALSEGYQVTIGQHGARGSREYGD